MTAAVAYLRVSSEGQRGSLAGQQASIAAYARAHGLTLVRRYADEGRSGLRLAGRPALQALLRDALGAERVFRVILVQDVSRFGRFQDVDEAAHYEFVCRQAGVEIRYCDEPFSAQPGSGVLKAVKRIMAAEFSRELSARTRRTQYELAAAGLKMGGVAGYGLRRAIVTSDGTQVLAPGERAAVQGARVRLILGPDEEVATVRRIYRLYLGGLGLQAIADRLNADDQVGEGGRPWAGWTIGQVLANPKYAGDYLFGRRRRTLGGGRRNNPPDAWQVTAGALPALVPRRVFEAAARRRRGAIKYLTAEACLARVRAVVRREGLLASVLVRRCPSLPAQTTLHRRFGPLHLLNARLGCYPSAPDISPGLIDAGGRSVKETYMPTVEPSTVTAFHGERLVAQGALAEVALAVQRLGADAIPMPVIFDDRTGAVVEVDLRGDAAALQARLARAAPTPPLDAGAAVATPRGRGRPRLGVLAREVTLLPEHWTWLAAQPGGASAALRRLVAQAQRAGGPADDVRAAQEAAYKVMYALAGHLGGYERALRALYAGDPSAFEAATAAWPGDVRGYVGRLARRAFDRQFTATAEQG